MKFHHRGHRGFSVSCLHSSVGRSAVRHACGRKGPPLAPIVYLPRPVTELVAKRVEDEVVLQFKVPTANTDNSSPADLDRLEVYAHTGPLPATADFLKYGTLVHRIEIKQPPRAEKSREQRARSKVKQVRRVCQARRMRPGRRRLPHHPGEESGCEAGTRSNRAGRRACARR